MVFVAIADIDECNDARAICTNGVCTNTFGAFRCVCNAGYELTGTGDDCIGTTQYCSTRLCYTVSQWRKNTIQVDR